MNAFFESVVLPMSIIIGGLVFCWGGAYIFAILWRAL